MQQQTICVSQKHHVALPLVQIITSQLSDDGDNDQVSQLCQGKERDCRSKQQHQEPQLQTQQQSPSGVGGNHLLYVICYLRGPIVDYI